MVARPTSSERSAAFGPGSRPSQGSETAAAATESSIVKAGEVACSSRSSHCVGVRRNSRCSVRRSVAPIRRPAASASATSAGSASHCHHITLQGP